MNFELGDDVIQDVISAKPGVIEKVLMMLRVKLNRAEWELKRNPPAKSKGGGGKKESDKPEADQYMGKNGFLQVNRRTFFISVCLHFVFTQ